MKLACIRACACVVAIAMTGVPVGAQETQKAAASPERIAELVKGLGSDDFKAREAAQKELAQVGSPAKSELEKAAKGDDMEVTQRATALLAAIAQQEADARSQAIAKKLMWSVSIDGGAARAPVICGKTLLAIGDDDSFALNIETGKKLWSFEAKGDSLLAAAGSVAAVADNEKVQALDLKTGKLKWKYDSFGGNAPFSVTAGESAVYVNDGGGKLTAISTDEGKELWKVDAASTVRPMFCSGKMLLLAGNEGQNKGNAKMAMAGMDNILQAMDVDGGKELWRYKTDVPITSFSVGKDAAYVVRQQDMVALDLQSGKQLWACKLPEIVAQVFMRMVVNGRQVNADSGPCPPVVVGDTVYVLLGQTLVGVSAKAGEKTVEYKMEDSGDKGQAAVQMRAAMMVVNGRVQFGGTSSRGQLAFEGQTAYIQRGSKLMAVDVKALKMLWSVDVGGPLSGPPVLSDGVLYFGTRAGADVAGNPDQKKADGLKLEPGVHALKVKAERSD